MDPDLLVVSFAATVIILAFIIQDVRRWVSRKVRVAYQMGLTAGANAARLLDGLTPEPVVQDVQLVRGEERLNFRIRALGEGELAFLDRSPGGASVSELVALGLVEPSMSLDEVRRYLPALEQHHLANAIMALSGLTEGPQR